MFIMWYCSGGYDPVSVFTIIWQYEDLVAKVLLVPMLFRTSFPGFHIVVGILSLSSQNRRSFMCLTLEIEVYSGNTWSSSSKFTRMQKRYLRGNTYLIRSSRVTPVMTLKYLILTASNLPLNVFIQRPCFTAMEECYQMLFF